MAPETKRCRDASSPAARVGWQREAVRPRSERRGLRMAIVAALVAVLGACTVKTMPPESKLVTRLDIATRAERSVDEEDAKSRLATRETRHFLPFELLEGVPVLGIFDALTVEYQAFDRFVLERDLERFRRYYRARGFYDAAVWAGRVIEDGTGRVRIEIVVSEGEPVLLGAAEVVFPEGLSRPPEELDSLFDARFRIEAVVAEYRKKPAVSGEGLPRFDEERFDDVAKKLARTLGDAGFAYATVERSADVDLRTRRARVRFSVHPGPLATFGDLTIVGAGELGESVIRQRAGIVKGARYSSEVLDAAHDELAALGVFGSIEVVAELSSVRPPPSAVVPISVRLEPVNLRALRLGIGAEVGSRLEAHGIAGWEDRNALGGLRHLAIETRPGLVLFPTRAETLFSTPPTEVIPQATLGATFEQPGFIERRTDLHIRAALRVYAPQISPAPEPLPDDFNIVGYAEVDGAVGLERTFRFPRLARSQLNLSVFVRTRLDVPFSYNLDAAPDGYESVVIPYLHLFAAWDLRKGRSGAPTTAEPVSGVYAALDTQLAAGDTEDVRVAPEARLFAPLAERLVVALRWTTGFLFPFNYGDSLNEAAHAADSPARSRDLQLVGLRAFYGGGPYSNRGYGYREIGPHAVLPFVSQGGRATELLPTGGLGMWELSGELRFKFSELLGAVAFLDSSDVVATLGDFRLTHPHLSSGAGLRVATPVGPIRIDVGFRPPYLQRVGERELEPEEGGPSAGEASSFPWAWALAIGEAF